MSHEYAGTVTYIFYQGVQLFYPLFLKEPIHLIHNNI